MPGDEALTPATTTELESDPPASEDTTAVSPPPWRSWAEVWEVREPLKAHRWLLLRRPDHLTTEQQGTIDAMVTGPVSDQVGVALRFLAEWYRLWRTEGQRRALAEAQERYEHWRTDPAYQALPPLRKVQYLLTPARFARLSQFLRHPHFEATNNGAERAGRAFRLRSEVAIEGALRVVMAQAEERASTRLALLQRLCSRGCHAGLAG